MSANSGARMLYSNARALLRDAAGNASASISSRKVWCGSSDEATNLRARITSPSVVSTPVTRPFSTRMRSGVVEVRIVPPASITASSRARASCAAPPRQSCALAGLASKKAMWWPKPSTRMSTSRKPLKNSRPAWIAGCSNSRRTNWSGDSVLTSRSFRPSGLFSRIARRSALGRGGEVASGIRIFSTIGTKSSCQRLSVAASVGLSRANDSAVRSRAGYELSESV